jgi:hypothetical protein
MMDNIIILTIGFLWTRFYLYGIVAKNKGIIRSHSHSAKYYPKLFFTYIIGLTVPWAYVGYDLMTGIACGVLFMISTITGYNENIRNKKAEDWIHVGAVWVSVAVSVIWILMFDLRYLGIIVPVFMTILILVLGKIRNHTWWVEEILEYMIYFVLINERILI